MAIGQIWPIWSYLSKLAISTISLIIKTVVIWVFMERGDLVCTIHIPWQTFFTINLGNVNSVLIQNAKPAPVALLSVAQKA